MGARVTLAKAREQATESIMRTAGGYCALRHPTRDITCDGLVGHDKSRFPEIRPHESWAHRGEPWTAADY